MATGFARFVLVLVVAWELGAPVQAQPPANVPVRAEPFANVLAEWNRVDQQIAETAQRYRESNNQPLREQARNDYLQLLDISRQTLARLRVSGVAEYSQFPNQNPEVTKTLLGILSNDVRTDDYLNAAELARVLIVNKCSEIPLWDLAGKAAYCVDDFSSAKDLLLKANEYQAIDDVGKAFLATIDAQLSKWKVELSVRTNEMSVNDLPRVRLQTTKGDVILELYETEAPQTVANFVYLVDSKMYDNLTFHRVLAGFMAQTGCPKGDGTGGPGYTIYDEHTKANRRNHFSGSLSMANTGQANTGGSQFFLTFRPTPELDGKHTVFGRVIEGFEVLSRIQRIDPQRPTNITPDRIVRATVIRRRQHAYEPTKVQRQ